MTALAQGKGLTEICGELVNQRLARKSRCLPKQSWTYRRVIRVVRQYEAKWGLKEFKKV